MTLDGGLELRSGDVIRAAGKVWRVVSPRSYDSERDCYVAVLRCLYTHRVVLARLPE